MSGGKAYSGGESGSEPTLSPAAGSRKRCLREARHPVLSWFPRRDGLCLTVEVYPILASTCMHSDLLLRAFSTWSGEILTPRINRFRPGVTTFPAQPSLPTSPACGWSQVPSRSYGGGANQPAERRWPPFISFSRSSGCRDFIRRRTTSVLGFLST